MQVSGPQKKLTILGIDPGLAHVGVGVIVHEGHDTRVALAQDIKTERDWELARRLKYVHDAIRAVAQEHRPDAAAIESLYFAKNVRTAVAVAQARGVCILATADAGIELFEYTPLQIKQAVAGYGRAGKDQMVRMVQLLLGLEKPLPSDHTADALAAAICHSHYLRLHRIYALAEKAERSPGARPSL
jgi:crossover junction endodeoxyribonuclease RuvC